MSKAAPTTHRTLTEWVEKIIRLTEPKDVHWVDGSPQERERLISLLEEQGTLTRLTDPAFPDSYAAQSDPDDVARVEERTFICSREEKDAGHTNNWVDPELMKTKLTGLFEWSMRGRTLYVVPFVMGHLDADEPKFGVEITDSPYVVLSMGIMARTGQDVLDRMTELDAPFVQCLHSVGMPLEDGAADVPWPCNPQKYIVHFPEERAIWSYGSGYGGNALLGKKCFALRIASAMARDGGWLAEHMLLLKLTSPQGRTHYIAGAFPSACGKTNLAMLEPTIPGWSVETLGDDIVWFHFDEEGRLRAINPETGLFGVAPGTGWDTNPNAMRAIERGGSVFTNVARTDEGGVWWEGMTEEEPERLTDWQGREWTPASGSKAAHPNSRFCTPIRNVPILAKEYDDPAGVPVSAILFGGRRKTTMPLVAQSRDWEHGVFMGATLSSETTAAAKGAVGVVRRDPMAMLPFLGYNAGDYLAHWLKMGERGGAEMPAVFTVNWFRRDDEGGFLWPGFGENARVLKWIVERLEGQADAVETPVGLIPEPDALDTAGLGMTDADVEAATGFRRNEWLAELPQIEEWFAQFGDSLPEAMRGQLDRLRAALAAD